MTSLRFIAAAALFAGAGSGIAMAQGIPPGHMPPPGSCRVWYPGVPPGRQPPPTDCDTAERQADRHGGRVIYGGRHGRDDDRWDRDDDRWDRDDDDRGRWRGGRDQYIGHVDVTGDRRLYAWALDNFDANGNGRLGAAERRAANAEFRRLADANGDGRLTLREYRQARRRLTGA